MLNSQSEMKLAAQAGGSGGSGAGGLHKSPLTLGLTWRGGGERWSSCLHHQKLLLSPSSAHFLGLPGGQLNRIISRATPAASAGCRAGAGTGTHGWVSPLHPLGDLGLGAWRVPPAEPWGRCAAQHRALPTAIELRKWVGHGPSGNDPKTTGDQELLPVGAPRVGGRGHWVLVATEHLARDSVFGSHSILCLFHSSPSSFSPFKALRLCRTETISWPWPRTWLLRSALSWALSGCQPWQEPRFAIPPGHGVPRPGSRSTAQWVRGE